MPPNNNYFNIGGDLPTPTPNGNSVGSPFSFSFGGNQFGGGGPPPRPNQGQPPGGRPAQGFQGFNPGAINPETGLPTFISGQPVVGPSLNLLNQGPTEQQQATINQITQERFRQGAQGLQQQAGQLSSLLSGSAAARGLGQSSIGLGQQSQLGQRLLQQLGNLQGNLQTAGAQQLFEVPFRNTALALQGAGIHLGHRQSRRGQDIQREIANQSSSGLGGILGGVAGSFLGPLGTAAGSALGGL